MSKPGSLTRQQLRAVIAHARNYPDNARAQMAAAHAAAILEPGTSRQEAETHAAAILRLMAQQVSAILAEVADAVRA